MISKRKFLIIDICLNKMLHFQLIKIMNMIIQNLLKNYKNIKFPALNSDRKRKI